MLSDNWHGKCQAAKLLEAMVREGKIGNDKITSPIAKKVKFRYLPQPPDRRSNNREQEQKFDRRKFSRNNRSHQE